MRQITTALILAASVAAASSIYAQTNQEPSGLMMGHGMMGDKNTNEGGMMGMMNMMQRMSRMMDHCGQMMSGNPRYGGRPNDQWRKESPATPGPSR